MCFGGGTRYKVKSKAAWGNSERDEASGALAQPHRYGTQRYGPHCSYYPAQYYTRAPHYGRGIGSLQHPGNFMPRSGVIPCGHFHGGAGPAIQGRAVIPGHAVMVSLVPFSFSSLSPRLLLPAHRRWDSSMLSDSSANARSDRCLRLLPATVST
jgi:hypothetical protein